MSHARLSKGLRRSLPSGLAALAALVVFVGCDGGPTDAGEDAPVALVIHDGSAPPFGMLYVGVDGFDVPSSGVNGHIGTAAVTAYPTEEPGEMAILVPQLSPGSYQLTLEWGGRVARGQVTVTAGAAPADATAYVASSFDETLALIAEQEAMYADTALRPVAVDSVAFRTSLESVRTAVEQAQTEFAALSAAEQAEVAAFIAAHPEIYAPLDASALSAAAAFSMAAANPICADNEDWFDCVFRNIEIIRNLAAGYVVGAAVVNTVAWFLTPAGKVAAQLGTAAGAAALLTYAGMTINDYLIQENFVDLQMPEGPLEFYANRPRVLEITGRYRSLTTADLQQSSLPGAARVGTAFDSLTAMWGRVQAALPLITIDPPRPPAQPLRSALRRVPGNELTISEVLTQGVGATWEHNTTTLDWLVTFHSTSTSDLPLVFRVARNTWRFPSEPITISADLHVVPDSLPLYEDALLGWWTMNHDVHTYDLELLAGGTGYYHVTEDDVGSKPGIYRMNWSVLYDDASQRYYFRDSEFFNGWSPTSPLSYPLTSMQDTTGAVTYQR